MLKEICCFLKLNGFKSDLLIRKGQEVVFVQCAEGDSSSVRCIVPVSVCAGSATEAQKQADEIAELLETLESEGIEPIVITEDRWRRQGEMMKARLLAHLDVFTSLYARNCEVRKIDKAVAAPFLEGNHSYGDAACR